VSDCFYSISYRKPRFPSVTGHFLHYFEVKNVIRGLILRMFIILFL